MWYGGNYPPMAYTMWRVRLTPAPPLLRMLVWLVGLLDPGPFFSFANESSKWIFKIDFCLQTQTPRMCNLHNENQPNVKYITWIGINQYYILMTNLIIKAFTPSCDHVTLVTCFKMHHHNRTSVHINNYITGNMIHNYIN